ncbi:MAG: potassium channel protein [Desulfobacteraceae bacterium]|nr:potassium channel protein [Desulfobacteraceae bacterium]
MPKGTTKKVTVSGLMLVAILLFGAGGYMLIEGSTFFDGLYMTVITIFTVGFEEAVPLHPLGRAFTMLLILLGAGFVLYLFGEMTQTMVEGGLERIFGRKNMEKRIAGLKDHFIVCGYGRIGRVICKILKENGRPFVVIENNAKEIQALDETGFLALEGNAAEDEVLLRAGIKQAKGLVAVVSSDAENVYITLSARGLNPDLFIMARSGGEEGAEIKLLRAGATKVISPYFIGACRMAQQILRPTVIDFIDLTLNSGIPTGGLGLGLRLEELSVSESAAAVNKSLQDSGIRKEHDLIVVAIKREEGGMLFNPSPQTVILPRDILVVLGKHEDIKALEREL